ncbi:MAG: Crp/Fnr family transcriptional regulator [Prevotella sp.]|jgi:CRP-like cAMP-binding protein|nr:Crp/Fnr family transcriptional regulator [Prevotella sp.]
MVKKEINKKEIAESVHLLWDPLVDEQRELFVENISVQQYSNNEIIFREGDTPAYLYYLMKGKVTIRREGIAGQQQIIRMVEPHALFGYASAIEGGNYKTTAVAGENTEVFMIPVSLMFHLIWENSDFAMLFLKDLSALLGLSVERTVHLTQKHIRGRLAEALIHLNKKYGVEGDGQTLAVYLSREDLAQMSNMTTSNAIRTLSSFAQEGIIAIEGRKIKFINLEELQQISDRG